MNGFELDFDNNQIEKIYLEIADSKLSRDDLESLFRIHIIELRAC